MFGSSQRLSSLRDGLLTREYIKIKACSLKVKSLTTMLNSIPNRATCLIFTYLKSEWQSEKWLIESSLIVWKSEFIVDQIPLQAQQEQRYTVCFINAIEMFIQIIIVLFLRRDLFDRDMDYNCRGFSAFRIYLIRRIISRYENAIV